MSKKKVSPLAKLPGFKETPGPVVAVIMDGLGVGDGSASDGFYMSYTPVLDELLAGKLTGRLKAHGTAVGLPTDKDMGNSEVGHNALGAGRVFSQGAKLVEDAIESGAVFTTSVWKELLARSQNEGTIHFIGLVSDGNVHSHIKHLYALVERAAADNMKRVRVHALLDGRDVGQKSALQYITPLEEKLRELSTDGRDYRIASGGGRMMVTMDRYGADWSVVERGWKAHVLGDVAEGRCFSSAVEAVEKSYAEDDTMTDQYMDSFILVEEGKPVGTVEDGDGVVFFNFRGDRAIEISEAFDQKDFDKFDRVRVPKVFYAGMMQYDGDTHIPKEFLVQPPHIDRTLGEYLCATGLTSYAISETQKFGHVTYFWNGNKLGYIDEKLEKYVEIPSDVIAFDIRPWMKAEEITAKVIEAIQSGKYSFIRLNYPNADMVGHTGVEAAVRIAVETVDLCLGRLLAALAKAGGTAFITADHGNADIMWTEKDGRHIPMVSHTLNPVPFIIKDYSSVNPLALSNVENPSLTHVAATLCNLLGYEPPEGYNSSLVKVG
ncbi:2,3-bisphosphoglycerate-independent phosphoglycerate mutase [Desulforhopalus vacuolatus]|uniref:2,3-bisphosphoglycerate-independent phosphoglycerate mutase n=1 Tax=Desulforhopalus vacuolatus TaxID=40414 RepID=UPI00196292F3|nr:2,3-bisphosphoglycerate-independent phosphoglycerate mutase [Desulforhopalus vacuolatus]MBM9519841.1 2,3-bisphosphoglycerate-independent phosphoglycerate mutase [Desulforhopalus vacuolatus]